MVRIVLQISVAYCWCVCPEVCQDTVGILVNRLCLGAIFLVFIDGRIGAPASMYTKSSLLSCVPRTWFLAQLGGGGVCNTIFAKHCAHTVQHSAQWAGSTVLTWYIQAGYPSSSTRKRENAYSEAWERSTKVACYHDRKSCTRCDTSSGYKAITIKCACVQEMEECLARLNGVMIVVLHGGEERVAVCRLTWGKRSNGGRLFNQSVDPLAGGWAPGFGSAHWRVQYFESYSLSWAFPAARELKI